MKNNFYTILPSNSCTRIHPDNKASKFIVELQNPIYLEGQWEVAMLDFTFVYNTFPFYSKSKIEYETMVDETMEVIILVDNKEKTLTVQNNPAIKVRILGNLFVNINTIYEPHILTFDNIENAKRFGFVKLMNNMQQSQYSIHFSAFKNITTTETIKFNITYTVLKNRVIKFKDELYLAEIDELSKYFLDNCSSVFKTFTVKKDQLFYFTLQDKVTKVTFDKILTETLGLDKQQYLLDEMTGIHFSSNRKPKLIKYHHQMFIYSSIVEPIIVGDVNVPLLKSIWLEQHEHGDVVQIIVENPMYLPIATTCINNIEINIRDDSGKLINFAKDSKTHLTLHFRKINNES